VVRRPSVLVPPAGAASTSFQSLRRAGCENSRFRGNARRSLWMNPRAERSGGWGEGEEGEVGSCTNIRLEYYASSPSKNSGMRLPETSRSLAFTRFRPCLKCRTSLQVAYLGRDLRSSPRCYSRFSTHSAIKKLSGEPFEKYFSA